MGFEGELDVSAILDLEDSASAIRQLNGHLRSGIFGAPDRPILRELRGALSWEDESLRSDRLQALIGTTSVELTDFELATRDGVTVVRTTISAEGLPLDYDHLGSLFDAETLAILLDDLHWDGRIDIEGGELEVRRAPGGRGDRALPGARCPWRTCGSTWACRSRSSRPGSPSST